MRMFVTGRQGSLRADNQIAAFLAPQTVYYPGANAAAEAQELRLQSGEERSGVDFVVPIGQPTSLYVSILAAQAVRMPSPDPAPLPTGAVRGRVVATDGRPLAHAQVLLFTPNRADSKAATTGDDGRFEVEAIAAGPITISVSKAGYTQLESGRPAPTGPGASGRTLNLRAGELRERVDLTLARWGALSGRVADERGDPIQGASVQLLQVRYEAGRRRLVVVNAPRVTDDLGRYRLHGLAPGQYIVSASVGQVLSADLPGYARSYYPGTVNPGEAQFVAVGLSQDLIAIDFAMSRVKTARVAGTVFDPDGDPAMPATLTLAPSQRSSSVTSVAVGARIAPDGTFDFPNVPPGQYVIQAYRGRLNAQTEGEFGALPVVVNGTDITGLSLHTSSGSSITGRFTFDAFDRTITAKPSELELAPIPADFDLSPPNNLASAEIHSDWTFAIAGLNGPRRLQILRAPPGWALREIRVNGIDVTDRPLSFGRRDQSLTNVEVVMTDRIAELGGTIADDRARPVPASHIVVFSTDRDRWYPASRYLRHAIAGPDGRFTVAGLPSGAYYASAVAQVPEDGSGAWQDPQYLESLAARASTVTVVDGQKAQIAVRLSVP
jgi:hypothetical protein